MVQIDILMDVRGIIALARSYADYVSLNTYEAKEYVTSERPAALLIQYLIALSSSLCSSGCASGPNGVRASGFKGGWEGCLRGCHGNCTGVLRVIKPGKKMHACV